MLKDVSSSAKDVSFCKFISPKFLYSKISFHFDISFNNVRIFVFVKAGGFPHSNVFIAQW